MRTGSRLFCLRVLCAFVVQKKTNNHKDTKVTKEIVQAVRQNGAKNTFKTTKTAKMAQK